MEAISPSYAGPERSPRSESSASSSIPSSSGRGRISTPIPVPRRQTSSASTPLGVDLVFLPPVAEIYPAGAERSTRVEVPGLSSILCGATRPTFFRGVATVVSMLFNVIQPDVALLGEKDYQQLLVVRRLVQDLKLPVAVESAPTVREADGLAMSSRNRYLDARERSRASALYRFLLEAAERIRGGERDYHALGLHYMKALERAGFRPEYFTARRAEDLASPTP